MPRLHNTIQYNTNRIFYSAVIVNTEALLGWLWMAQWSVNWFSEQVSHSWAVFWMQSECLSWRHCPVVSSTRSVPQQKRPDTCRPDTSCIHLNPLVGLSLVAVYIIILYRRQNRHHGDMYPLVSGYKLLVQDTCIRLHVSGVNAA